MKAMRLCFLIIFCMGAVCADELEDEWKVFKSKFNKTYSDDEPKRFANFKENFAFVRNHNNDMRKTFKVELNRFADLEASDFTTAKDEMKKGAWTFFKETFFKKMIVGQTVAFNPDKQVPSQVDWRPKFPGNYVKDQRYGEHCNSAYAFATINTLEAHYFIKNQKHLDLSEQEVLDCSTLNQGCRKGNDMFTYNFLISDGIASEKDYKYTSKDGECKKDDVSRSSVEVFGYGGVSGVENFKKALDQYGPLTVKVQTTFKSFRFYKNGIYSDSSCNGTNAKEYAVLYGYGFDNSTGLNYWIIQNSWSKNWGENGFMRLEMKADLNSSCLNTKTGFFALLDKSASDKNETLSLSEHGIGLLVFIIAGILISCCCCCACFCFCVKWCMDACSD